jgi:hypothetical protein
MRTKGRKLGKFLSRTRTQCEQGPHTMDRNVIDSCMYNAETISRQKSAYSVTRPHILYTYICKRGHKLECLENVLRGISV